MASVYKAGKGKCPPKGIKFYDRGIERRISLGKVTVEDARDFCRWVEQLISDREMNRPHGPETARWLVGLMTETHAKLSAKGLCDARNDDRSKAPPLGEWLTRFVAERRGELAPSSIQRLNVTARWLMEYFGDTILIDALTPDAAKSWRAWLAQQPIQHHKAKRGKRSPIKPAATAVKHLTEATLRLHCRNVKSIFNDAVARELLPRNPFNLLKSASVAAVKNRFVTAQEAERIIDQCPSSQWRLLFGLARYAGLRCPSETHGLLWSNVNWAEKLLTIYAPKTKQTRQLPIDPRLLPLLEAEFDALPEGAAAEVITIPPNNRHNRLEAIIRKAGLTPWDDLLQTLRRSCETEWLAGSVPHYAVAKWLGHGIEVSEKHYAMIPSMVLDQVRNDPGKVFTKSITTDPGKDRKTPESEIIALTEKPTSKTAKGAVNAGFSTVPGVGVEPPKEGLPIPYYAASNSPLSDDGQTSCADRANSTPEKFSLNRSLIGGSSAPVDALLAELIARWPKLPGDVRRRIVGMVRRRDQ